MVGDSPLFLKRMPQQPGLLGAEDDWTGVTSSAVRRRVQNRLNQRAYRKRRYLEKKQWKSSGHSGPLPETPRSNTETISVSDSETSETAIIQCDSPENELWKLYSSAADRSSLDRQKLSQVAKICKLGPIEQQKIVSEFEKWVAFRQGVGSARMDHLLIMVKFNVLRAILSNGVDLGYMPLEGIYDSDTESPLTNPSNPLHARSIPPNLRPTMLQRQIPHHPWIDILPCPVLRDNLLLAGDTYDVMEFCADLVGFFSHDKGRMNMIAWGEPWDIGGWEITESFVKHWGWMLQGCEQLLQSTNHWRKRRGERPLQISRILHELK